MVLTDILQLPIISSELRQYIKSIGTALDRLYKNDTYLINQKMERECVGRILGYLMCEEENMHGLTFDTEYHKDKDDVKKLNGAAKRPDIILHHRGNDCANKIWIEFKTQHRYQEHDLQKLRDATRNDGQLRYELGLFIMLDRDRHQCRVVFNGEEIPNPEN